MKISMNQKMPDDITLIKPMMINRNEKFDQYINNFTYTVFKRIKESPAGRGSRLRYGFVGVNGHWLMIP